MARWTAAVGLLLIVGCGETAEDPPAPVDAVTPDTATPDTATPDMDEPDAAVPVERGDCDPLIEAACALPWPSSLYLVEDAARTTGFTLTFGAESLPQSYEAKHIEPEPYRVMDGYGLGTPLIVLFPDVDMTGFPTDYDTAPSLAEDAPILWFDEDGERVPYWVELDSRAPDEAQRAMLVRPAVILKEATRYYVAFRDLKDASGATFPPSEAFSALVKGTSTDPRQARFAEVLEFLDGRGAPAQSLQLAWDFVTASSDALHGRMLHMRKDAFEVTGPQGPELTITEVQEFTEEENPHLAMELRGTVRVPHYMKAVPLEGGTNAWAMNLDADGKPAQDGYYEPPIWIRVPRSALTGEPHGLVEYGHGQNGSGKQVRGSFNDEMANEHKLIFFATDMHGMSGDDVPTIAIILFDISRFTWMADRLHQGVLNHLLLARAMRERFDALPVAQEHGITVDKTQLYYSGISQGGIYGATFTALSQDITRAHLGVPGNNYSFMISRSKNFEPFLLALDASYPQALDQVIAASTAQLLWDATDPISYYRHLSDDPFEDTPVHHVLLAPAKADPQVPVTANEVVARTGIGVEILANYDKDRVVSGVEETPYPHTGSGVVLYDFGDPWPTPAVNVPPADSEQGDPHNKPKKAKHHQQQMVHFFKTGTIIDVCNGDGCAPD